MKASEPQVFVIDCPRCRANVAAIQAGMAERTGYIDYDKGNPFGERLYVGKCPKCSILLAGECIQLAFEAVDSEFDEWSDITRVFPKPTRKFQSGRIPRVVTDSLREATSALQVDASTAACVMMGRALEALCRDKLPGDSGKADPKIKLMLGKGIQRLKEKGIIDQRLFSWSQELQAFRNIAAHPDDTVISREDAEDLLSFVHAIVEYVYDLTERYEEFMERTAKRRKKK